MSVVDVKGEVAVIGLGKSGKSVSELLVRHAGRKVYASDLSTSNQVQINAKALSGFGVDVGVGSHDLPRIANAGLVVVSPGVPPNAPPLLIAKEQGIPVVSEVEVALWHMPALKYVAVTGTNGKTTTTNLIGTLFRALGSDAVEAGNVGTALSEIALRDKQPDWVVLEMSSFQLHDTPSIRPNVGVLTNLSPDHLDRYNSVEEYYSDKAKLFANASVESHWITNADDEAVMRMAENVPGNHHTFAVQGVQGAEGEYCRSSQTLCYKNDPFIGREQLTLFGDHNVANVLAAWLAVFAGVGSNRLNDWEPLREALKKFRPPPHRLELIGEYGGVQWINDSKATNVSSALVAASGMTRPTVLLLGGRHKGEPYTPLIDAIRRNVKHVIAYGEAAGEIVRDLNGTVSIDKLGSDFEEVITRAREMAEPGDVILLSPACSSYDMFNNYEERGAVFRRLASCKSAA